MLAIVCPRAAQCATQPAGVIASLMKASTLSVRPETLSLRHPTAIRPARTFVLEFGGAKPMGALELEACAVEEVATSELTVLGERADGVCTAEEEAGVGEEEETRMATSVVVVGLAEEDTDDDVYTDFATPDHRRSCSLRGENHQSSFHDRQEG